MLVTLHVGVQDRPRVGHPGFSWVGWAASRRGRAELRGGFRERKQSQLAAELSAVANAVWSALRTGVVRPGDEVRIKSVGRAVAVLGSQGQPVKNDLQADVWLYLTRLRAKYQLEMMFVASD